MSELMGGADRKERIRRIILSAFAEVAFPREEHVALRPDTFEGEEIDQIFAGRHWRDLPHELVIHHVIIFFRPEARHFYLPAFLLASLDALPAGPVDLDVYALKPPDDDTRFRQEYDAYSRDQREAIRLFLEYARDEASDRSTKRVAQLALKRYWARADQDVQNAALDELETAAEPSGKERARQVIRESFNDVPYPGDEAIAYNPTNWEGRDINLDFAGHHWRELSHAVLSYHQSALTFFSAKGMHFYLPAYLVAALDGDSNILDGVIYSLTPPGGNADDSFKERYELFTPAQRQAIQLFLEYVRDEMTDVGCSREAQVALDRYWHSDAPEQAAG